MSRFSSLLLLLFLLFLVCVQAEDDYEWAKTVTNSGGDKTTTLRFYFHDIQSGKTPSAIPIARGANSTNYLTGFGTLFIADDKLTAGPEPESKLVGRAQGLYGSACQEELQLIMAMSYSFTDDGVYNGSTISVMGRNSVTHPERELPVVGGTGVFRMARGYAIARTHWVDFTTGDAIVGYNVTLFH